MREYLLRGSGLALFASLLLGAAHTRALAAEAAAPLADGEPGEPLPLTLTRSLLPEDLAHLQGQTLVPGDNAGELAAQAAALPGPGAVPELATGEVLQPALTLADQLPGAPGEPVVPGPDGMAPPLAPVPESAAEGPPADADPLAKLIQEGLQARQAGQFALARERFRSALALDPARPDVLHLLGLTDAYDKDYSAATDHLDAAQALVPNDVDITLDRARVLSWSGHLPEAAALVDGVLVDHPEDGEAWDLRARLHWYQSQPVEAEAAARKAVAIDPLSTDFKLMLAQSLAAQSRYPEAGSIARELAPLRPNDADVSALLQAEVDNRPRPWRVDIALSHSSFERIPLQVWQGLSVQLNRQLSASDTVYGRVDSANRFGQGNTSLTVGDAHVFGPGFGAYGEVTVTPAATFFPTWRVAGGGELRVREDSAPVGATFLSLDGAIGHYNTGTSYGLSPGVIQYLDGGRAWISLHLNNSIDARGNYLNGWGVRGDLLVGTDWALHAGYSRAPESETEITGGIISVVRDFTLGASWQATPDLTLRLDYLREDRVRSYIRQEFILGGSYRF